MLIRYVFSCLFVHCLVQPIASNRICFDCQDSSNLASCTHVTVCGEHEECFLEKIIASDGTLYYAQGCRDRQRCGTTVTSFGKRSETTTCTHCCDTDFCNYKGCGEQGINDIHYQNLCLDCGDSLISGDDVCHKVSLCRSGKSCSVTKLTDLNAQPAYKYGCKVSSECTNIGPCNKCCTGAFCNYKCSDTSMAVGGGIHSTTTTPKPVTTHDWLMLTNQPPTNVPTQSPGIITTTASITSSWQQIYDRNSTFCYACKGRSTSSDCSEFTHCGSNQRCYIEEAVTSDGHVVILSGCSPKTACYSTDSGYSHNTVICHQCCEGDFCNSRGCSQQVSSTDESRYCLTCQGVNNPEKCKKIQRCSTDELCMIQPSQDLNGDSTIDMGCVKSDTCPSIPNQQCSGCCTGAYCNKDCKTLEQRKIVQTITVPVPTTTVAGLYRISCRKCAYVTHPSECHIQTSCLSGEICQLKEYTGSNGMKAYSLGCAKEETCWHGEIHARVGCCGFQECNKNINILQ